MNLLDLLSQDGFTAKKQTADEYSSPCPWCAGKDRFRIWPESGKYWCRQCHKSGDVIQYLRDRRGMSFPEAKAYIGEPVEDKRVRQAFKKKPSKPISQDKAEKYHAEIDTDTVEYLTGRGITQESIDKFKMGMFQGKDAKWLTVPHYQNGKLINIKYRKLPPADKEFRREKGAKSILFNIDCLKGAEEAYIAEGELDAISMIQEGVKNTVGNTIGCQAFDPEWIDQFLHIQKIYICYDQDEPGQAGARTLAKRLGYGRCYNVEFPDGQDANDYFMDNSVLDFNQLVGKARKFDLAGVIGFDTAIDMLRTNINKGEYEDGLLTQWDNVNRLTRGFHPGDLIVVAAPAKVGKTTFCLNIVRHVAMVHRLSAFFFCLEMRPDRLCQKVIQAHYEKANLTTEDIDRFEREFADIGLPLYFAHSYRKESLDSTLQLIRDAVKRYDFRLVVFDHLHFLVRSISNVNEEVGQAIQGFKLLAEEMEIPIIVIAQPRKREAGQRDSVMRAEDIKYSNAVHGDCDQMIILWRRRLATKEKNVNRDTKFDDGALDPLTMVRLEAHRFAPGGETLLDYNGECSRFDEAKN